MIILLNSWYQWNLERLFLISSSVELGAVWGMVACCRERWSSAKTFLEYKVNIVWWHTSNKHFPSTLEWIHICCSPLLELYPISWFASYTFGGRFFTFSFTHMSMLEGMNYDLMLLALQGFLSLVSVVRTVSIWPVDIKAELTGKKLLGQLASTKLWNDSSNSVCLCDCT